MKYITRVRQAFSKNDFPTFTMSDIRLLLKSNGVSYAYVRLMLHNLIKKGEIIQLTKGIYTFHHDVVVVGFAFRPFYYGLEDALMLRGLSGQGTNFIVMTTQNVRTGVRTFSGRNYVINRIRSEHFFGYDLIKYGEFWIPVSDVEKTVIDMIHFNGGIRDELWPGILKVLKMKKLREYLKGYKPGFRKRVVGVVDGQRGHKTTVHG